MAMEAPAAGLPDSLSWESQIAQAHLWKAQTFAETSALIGFMTQLS
jgi:hypothetical protein